MKSQSLQILLIGALMSTTGLAQARSGKNIRVFTPLKKITVGPFDNFQASVTSDESSLFFTRSQNLSSQVFKFDTKTGLTASVTKSDVDAKNAAVSQDGSRLAITYFGNDAKGDVCLVEKDSKISCITESGLGEHSPFWIDPDTLGYVQSNDRGSSHKLFTYNLKTKSKNLLKEGHIYGPSLAPGKNTLVYKAQGPEFVLMDLTSKSEIRRIKINLPGSSGLAKFSVDGNYIYFSQYMLDSNRDLILDSRDASAIFRLKLNDAKVFPEQLTSLDQNCSYPTPAKTKLYLTCAFEGALDVYSAPLEGITPANWSPKDVWEAHQAARTYSDKIMLLNQVMIRGNDLTESELEDRLFSNFVFMHAWMPAAFYAKSLKDKSPDYAVQLLLLETLTKWDALPSKENVAELTRMLSSAETNLKSLPASPMRQIAQAHIEFFRHRDSSALSMAKDAKPTNTMGLYWQTKIFERLLASKPGLAYENVLLNRVVSAESNEETRVYYLARLFDSLEKEKSRETFFSQLESKLKGSSDADSARLLELVQNERQIYRVLATEDQTAVRDELRQVVERVKRLKDNYFPLRLLFSRTIVLLQTNNRPRELSRVMSLWLSYVDPKSKEYPYAIEALRSTSLEAAYKFYHGPAQNKELAKGSFYSNIRTTDDLESHYQYVLMNSSKEAWTELLKTYETMVKDGLIEADSLTFVKAIHSTINSGKAPSKSELSKAASEVEKLSDNMVGVGAKYQFLGYLYHQQFQATVKGFEFDEDLAQKAHGSYLYAIDAAFNNERIQAAALQNLGLLHMARRNYAMAAEYFQKRHTFAYEDTSHQEAINWFAAKALYQSYRPAEAVAMVEEALALQIANRNAFLERQAFYAWNAGQYQKSAKLYESIIPTLGKNASSGIHLSYGYALMKSNQPDKAESALLKAVDLAKKEDKKTIAGINRFPQKIEFTARGLLARLPLSKDKNIKYLTARLALFDNMNGSAKDYYQDAATLKSQHVKEQFDLALAKSDEPSQAGQAPKELEKALKLAKDFGDDHGFLNQTIFTTLKNAMILGRKTPALAGKPIKDLIADITKDASKEFSDEKTPSNQLRKQWAELELVSLAYRLGQGQDFAKRFAEESDKLLNGPNMTELAKDRQDLTASVKQYRDKMAKLL